VFGGNLHVVVGIIVVVFAVGATAAVGHPLLAFPVWTHQIMVGDLVGLKKKARKVRRGFRLDKGFIARKKAVEKRTL
jgi:hypothetical protein